MLEIIQGQIVLFIILIILVFVMIIRFVYYQIISLLTKSELKKLHSKLTIDELNKELKPFGFAYNTNQDIFFSVMYPWQRAYGYCRQYDDASPLLSMIIDCEPIYFKYGNRKWLIEFWKGQYGMTTGGEIGIYVANENDDSFKETIYNSITDEECLSMSYTLKKKQKSLITRNSKHWWLTGFKLGEYSKPSNLTMDLSITFKNNNMLTSFTNSLEKIGYKKPNIKITNKTVSLTFDKPHNKQPITRNIFTNIVMQSYNKSNCKLYNKLTKNYNNSLDKINYIRSKFPLLYKQIMNFEKNEQVFQKYRPTPKNVK
ncbi:MAG: DUF4474 domain-containing protein [Ignavibacteriales bacterium]